MISICQGKSSIAVIALFIMLLTAQAQAQRERLQTPDPIDEFILSEKELINANENDSLMHIYPLLDSVHIYTITFSTLGREFKGYYVLPKHGTNLPVILYNLSDDVEALHFDHYAAIRSIHSVPRGHILIISDYYDQTNPPYIGNDSCKERNVITNMIDHLYLFPEIDPSRVIIKDFPQH